MERLSYQTRAPLLRRWVRKLTGAALVVILIASIHYRDSIIRMYRQWVLEWQCRHYVAEDDGLPVFVQEPPDRSAFLATQADQAPTTAELWTRLFRGHEDYRGYSPFQSLYHGGRIPACWTQYAQVTGLNTWTPPTMTGAPEGLIFLGILRSPDGNERLVSLSVTAGPLDIYRGIAFETAVIEPGGVFGTPNAYRLQIRSDIGSVPNPQSYVPRFENNRNLRPIFSSHSVVIYSAAITSDRTAFRAKVSVADEYLETGNLIRDDGWLVGTLTDSQTLQLRLEGVERMRRYLDVEFPGYIAELERARASGRD